MQIRDLTVGGSAWMRVCGPLLALTSACFFTTAARADLVVPSGAHASLGAGVVDLACTDLVVAGTLQVTSGAIKNIRHLTIQPGGSLDGGSGLIEVGGNWSNLGAFVAGSGTVRFRELCTSGAATISGTSTFFRVSFVTAIGRNYIFSVGTTQTIISELEISGTLANPIQFRSATPGQVAFIDLLSSGIQQVQHVGVTDVWATGQWLAPFQTNEGGGGNAHRWFGVPKGGGGGGPPESIPTLGFGALAALSVLLAAAFALISRQRQRNAGKTSMRAQWRDGDSL